MGIYLQQRNANLQGGIAKTRGELCRRRAARLDWDFCSRATVQPMSAAAAFFCFFIIFSSCFLFAAARKVISGG
jgi:hypothetical protein